MTLKAHHQPSTSILTREDPTRSYFSTPPGVLRILTIVLGVCCVALRVIGMEDDMETREDASLLYVSYYGLGYRKEKMNLWSLVILTTTSATSIAALLVLISHKQLHHRPWNRFLQLLLSCSTLLGWLCGLLGFLQFRQGCCRVEILSSDRIRFPNEGYSEPCLCLVTPTNDHQHSYPVLLPQDAPHDMSFLSAQPHHSRGQILSLILTLANVLVYLSAYFKF